MRSLVTKVIFPRLQELFAVRHHKPSQAIQLGQREATAPIQMNRPQSEFRHAVAALDVNVW